VVRLELCVYFPVSIQIDGGVESLLILIPELADPDLIGSRPAHVVEVGHPLGVPVDKRLRPPNIGVDTELVLHWLEGRHDGTVVRKFHPLLSVVISLGYNLYRVGSPFSCNGSAFYFYPSAVYKYLVIRHIRVYRKAVFGGFLLDCALG
jgi:hypothetical protein